MKKAQKFLSIVIAALMTVTLCSCNAMDSLKNGEVDMGMAPGGNYYAPEASLDNAISGEAPNAEEPSPDGGTIIKENPFISVSEQAISTFSADVDTASYTLLRKLINSGYSLEDIKNLANSYSIRTEEMVNYFNYNYNAPAEDEMFGRKVSIAKSPWNNDTYLMVLGLKAKEIEVATSNNLVFLIDVSGSMSSADKLPLLQEAFSYLVSQLDENDRVSIVTYAGSERVVLQGCSGAKKETILQAINDLSSGGSTNGEAGINKAYQIAEANFIPDGNNRIILASDGDLNVGISNAEQLEKLVSEKRDSGIFLSVLGFGTGNFKDSNMSAIAQSGNGVYHYIDCAAEAERIFATSLLSTLYTVAKDVKFQLEFDPDYVSEYRLIGYENRLLSTEDFDDDTKDAGDVGSGHTLTVCYELKLTEDAIGNAEGDVDTAIENWISLAIRYKEPSSDVSVLREYGIGEADLTDTPDEDFVFISCVIEASMLLRNSQFSNPETTTLESILSRLYALTLDAEKTEFRSLLSKLAN